MRGRGLALRGGDGNPGHPGGIPAAGAARPRSRGAHRRLAARLRRETCASARTWRHRTPRLRLRIVRRERGQISAGTVLFGTGVAPRTRLAEEAGLEVEGGVVTDSSMRTSAPGIFAVGDIARAYNESAGRHLNVEHWGDALEHGRIAGTVISGGEAAWGIAPGFWSTIVTRPSSTGPGETVGTSELFEEQRRSLHGLVR